MKASKWISTNLLSIVACGALGAALVIEVQHIHQRAPEPNVPVEAIAPKPMLASAKVRPPAFRSYSEFVPPSQPEVVKPAMLRKEEPKADPPKETPKDPAESQAQVQQLLGNGYFPGAEVDPASVETDADGNPVWPNIVLDVPGDRLNDVLDYYTQIYPNADIQDNQETVVVRPGDDRQMHLEVTEDDGQTRIVFREP
jgi:hypothetical protein